MERSKKLLIVGLTLICVTTALAAEPVNPVRQDKKGLAVKGYDVVAYFTVGQPTKGDPAFEHSWSGARWQFASAENLAAFRADPERYAPQYGGYCSYAVSKGKTASISPKAWTIVDDKLYLNHALAKGSFNKNREEAIARADENWPKIEKSPLD